MSPLNIDLGSSPKNCPTPCPDEGPYYPHLLLSDVPEGIEIPEHGKLLVEFCRIEKKEVVREGTKAQCSYVLEIRKLVSCDCENAPKESPSQKTEGILDALLREYQSGENRASR